MTARPRYAPYWYLDPLGTVRPAGRALELHNEGPGEPVAQVIGYFTTIVVFFEV